MTSTEARQTLDEHEAAIIQNADAYVAGEISYEEFHRRQGIAHAAIEAAGQHEHWSRRWRTGRGRMVVGPR